MTQTNKINVSEIFTSIQGEGSTAGRPSIFLRTQACNLMCGGQGTEKDGELHNGATWRCDTIEVWQEGDGWVTEELAQHLFDEYASEFLPGAQIVITGGEPLLQQAHFPLLIGKLQSLLQKDVRVEIETNGTITPNQRVQKLTNQFNVSPKLSNSGMPERRRIKHEPLVNLRTLSARRKAIFKFVVTREEDMQEIMDDYVRPFNMPKDRVFLMPGCSNREQFERVSPLVAEMCKKYGFHFSSRLQINLWNETTGV